MLLTDPKALVEKWSKLDSNYSQIAPHVRPAVAQLQENAWRSIVANPRGYLPNEDMRALFRHEGVALVKDPAVAKMCEQLKRARPDAFREDTTTADVAVTALQILPAVTRAFLISPFLGKGLVAVRGLTTPSANIPILDVVYGSAGGAYAADTRVDRYEDPTYSDSTDCMAAPREIDASITRETVSVGLKKLGNDTCIPAIQWADSQWGIDLRSVLRDMIQQVMVREWARNISDAIRTMASFSSTWSQTAPAPYSSLNTNEWRQVFGETLITNDASVRGLIYESTEWIVWTPAVAAILQRLARAIAKPVMGPTTQAGALDFATGQFGETWSRFATYEDPFLAANTAIQGRGTLTTTPTPVDPFMFLAYQMLADVSFLLYPKSQTVEMGGQTQAALKMLVPGAFCTTTVTA